MLIRPTIDEILAYIRKPIDGYFFTSEKQFEQYVTQQLPYIFEKFGLSPIRAMERQVILNAEFKGIPDIMVLHKDDSLSIIEVKCTTRSSASQAPMLQCSAIGQLLLYKTLIEAKKDAGIVRLLLITNKLDYRTLRTFMQIRLPISLVEINSTECFSPYLCV